MRVIFILVRKEIKELMTLQLLIPILIMVFFFMFIGRMMTREIKKASVPQKIIVADYDKSVLSQDLISILSKSNLLITETHEKNIDSLIKLAQKENINLMLVLPESLAQKINSLQPMTLLMYTLINGLSPFSDIGTAGVKSALSVLNESLEVRIIKQFNPDVPIATIKRPLNVVDYVHIKNQLIQANPMQIKNQIRVQNAFIPVILLLVIIYISQMIATAIGQEKENKTLETLLTFPVSRIQILVGKMLGSGVVAILLSIVFLLGMKFYLSPISQPSGFKSVSTLTTPNLGPSPTALYLVITISLFLAILCAASLATLLSSFATDAKQAQVVITPINLLVLFSYFITMFLDINSLSLILKIILYIIPFSYPFIIPQALFFNQIPLIIIGFAYMVIFAGVTTIIAAKIFSSDLILTAKLKIRRQATTKN